MARVGWWQRVQETLRDPVSWLGLGAAAGFSLATGQPEVLAAAAAAGALFVAVAPLFPSYARRLTARRNAASERGRRALVAARLQQLSPQDRQRYARLEARRAELVAHPDRLHVGPAEFDQVLERLDELLQSFLVLAARERDYTAYLGELAAEELSLRQLAQRHPARHSLLESLWVLDPLGPPRPSPAHAAHLLATMPLESLVEFVRSGHRRELEEMQRALASETDPAIRAARERRAQVLERREAYAARIGEAILTLRRQLELIEETAGMLADEVRARTPHEVLHHLEEAVHRSDGLAELLETLDGNRPVDPHRGAAAREAEERARVLRGGAPPP